jgi:uncharacterized alpha-E superfamily protein
VRPATEPHVIPVALASLSPGARERMLARIAEAPWNFTACAPVAPSLAPCVGPDAYIPRAIVLRLFLIWDGVEWRTMQGGLARALPHERMPAWRLPERGLAKDVWVLSETPGAIVGPQTLPIPPLAIRRTSGDLPSRVADNFFWLGRYLERLEGSARLQRAALARIARAAPTPREMAELHVLTDCLEQAHLVQGQVDSSLGGDALAAALLRAAREDGPTGRLLAQVSRMTSLLRDRLTGEMYAVTSRALRELTETLRGIRSMPEGEEIDELAHVMTGILHFAATVAGLAAENMVRGGGRLFLDLGRRVERAQTAAAELAISLEQPGPAQPGRVEMALRLALELRDSVITYRSRYLGVMQPAPVLDLVLADEGNPRSLAFQLAQARDLLAEIAGTSDTSLPAAVDALLEDVRGMVDDVAGAGEHAAGAAVALAARLAALKDAVADLSDRVSRRYFALLPAARSVGLEAQPILRGAA